MKKRGISAVIATVLIILIVVVGVGIIWKVVLPLFAEMDYLSYSDVQLNIVFQGYTVYDPDQHFAFVQVERGRDEVNVVGLEIGFIFRGDSATYQTEAIPSPGGKYTYKFNFTADGLEEEGSPNKVTVAPLFLLNNQIKLGEILDEEDMPLGKVYLSEPEWENANSEAADNNITKGIGSRGEDEDLGCGAGEVEYGGGCAIVVNTMGTYNLNQVGATYVLNDNIEDDAIIISADNILLDGMGYNLEGSDSGEGISASDLTGLTIRNFGQIGGFERGIYFRRVVDSVIEENVMSSTYAGGHSYAIYLEDGDSNRVEGNTIDWNATGADMDSYGVFLNITSGVTAGNNEVIGNNFTIDSVDGGGWGVYLYSFGTSNSNVIQNNIVDVNAYSSGSGIRWYSFGTSNSNVIQNNTLVVDATFSGQGVYLQNSGTLMDSNVIQYNTVKVSVSAAAQGVYLDGAGTLMDSNVIQYNTINIDSSMYGRGVYLATLIGSVDSTIIKNNTMDITASVFAYGIDLYNFGSSIDSTVIDDNNACSLTGPVTYGFKCDGATGTSGTENEFAGNVEVCDSWPLAGIDYVACSCPLYPDCPGDVNGDNIVNMIDNSIISANWLSSGCGVINICCNGADLDADGFVNFVDFSIFANNNGNVC